MAFGQPMKPAGAEAAPGAESVGLPMRVTRAAAPLTTNSTLPIVKSTATCQPGLRQSLKEAAVGRRGGQRQRRSIIQSRAGYGMLTKQHAMLC